MGTAMLFEFENWLLLWPKNLKTQSVLKSEVEGTWKIEWKLGYIGACAACNAVAYSIRQGSGIPSTIAI